MASATWRTTARDRVEIERVRTCSGVLGELFDGARGRAGKAVPSRARRRSRMAWKLVHAATSNERGGARLSGAGTGRWSIVSPQRGQWCTSRPVTS